MLLCFQRVIQNNTLDDRSVHNKHQWDSAIRFMEESVKRVLHQSQYITSLPLTLPWPVNLLFTSAI